MMRALLLAAALLAAPTLAWADPATALFILTSSFEIAGIEFAVSTVLLTVGTFIYGTTKARRDARNAQAKARADYNASLQDRSVTALQALPPWRITVGRAISGGDVHAIFTTDKSGFREDGTSYNRPDGLKHLVVVFDDHEDQALHEIYIDGVALGPLDGSGFVTQGEFFSTRTDSRFAIIGGGGSVTVGQPVVSVLNAFTFAGFTYTDLTGSITLSGGNLTINGPAGARVNYTVQNNLSSVRVQKHLGTATQVVDAYLTGVAASQWTSTDRLLNKSYIVITLDLENQRFQGGPPGITADRSGRKVYDPRKDSTVAGGAGAHRNNNSATWEWSNNPALLVRDHLTAEWGFQAAQADINDAFTIAAANACDARVSATVQAHAQAFTVDAATDEIIFANDEIYGVGDGVDLITTGTLPGGLATATTYYVIRGSSSATLRYKLATSVANAFAGTAINITSAGTGTHTCHWGEYATYTANGVFTTADGNRESTLNDLCEAMAGVAVYGAQWEIIAGAWAATVMDLGDDDLAGQIEIVQADLPLEQLLNGVRGTFIPAGKSVPVEFDNYLNSTFVTDDGQEHWADLALPYTDSRVRARNLSRIRVETERNGEVIRYPAKLKAWPLQRGDRVGVSSTEYGFSLKSYRVTDWQFGLTSPVVLTLQEDDATAYDLADGATSDATPNTGLPSPWVVEAITGITAVSAGMGLYAPDGTWVPRVVVSWSAVTGAYLADGAGRIAVLWRDPRAIDWKRTEVASNDTSATITGMREGDVLVIEVAARNALQQYGPPSFLSHTVAVTQSAVPRGNLIDASTWVVGSSGSQGVAGGNLFNDIGDSGESSIVLGAGPDGRSVPLWRAISNDAVGGTFTDGGWGSTGMVPIDHNQVYRFAVWAKANVITPAGSINAGYCYFGLDGASAAAIATGTPDTNPYFVAAQQRQELVPGRWYLQAGFVLPSGIGTTPPSPTLGGVYDGVTGQRVRSATDYKWLSTAVQAYHRVFQWDAASTNETFFCSPRLEMCDGSEPSIDQLLAMAKTSVSGGTQLDFEVQFGLNGQFSNWVLGTTVPDGWTNEGDTNSRETTITRTGPNAVRSVSPGGATAGISRTISFGGLPLAAGSFVEGTLDAYLVSHTSGGYPGLFVLVYTNSGLSTYREVIVNLPNTGTGGWQTLPYKAAVNDGERIYGVRFYALSSYVGFPSGNGVNTVIFDSLTARAVQPSGTAHLVSGAATEVFTASGSPSTFTVTAIDHSPYQAGSKIISVTFTPSVSGKALAHFTGMANFSGTAGGCAWSIQDVASASGWNELNPSGTGSFNMTTSRWFDVTAGTAYEIAAYGHKFVVGDTYTVTQHEIRVEVIKR